MLLVQLLVLAFTGALWWIARRDLASRVPPPVLPAEAADTAELEQLCATLETLVTSLARRLDVVERQAEVPAAAAPFSHFEEAGQETINAAPPLPRPVSRTEFIPEPMPEPVPDPRYAPVYALLQAGVTDPIEIARQTGLGRGEVDLILSLRERRAF